MSRFYFVKARIADQYSAYDVLFTVKKTRDECINFIISYNKKVSKWKSENKVLLKKRGKLYGKLNGSLSMNDRVRISTEVNKIDRYLEGLLKKKKSFQKIYNLAGGCIMPFKFDVYNSTAYIQKFDDKTPMEIV